MDCSMPGPPVYHQLSESTHTHVHWVSDAIQLTHPLSSPSPALNLLQHQGLFHWVGSLHQVAKILGLQLQDWFPLGLTSLILLSKGLSRVFPNATVQKQCSAFFMVQLSHLCMTTGKTIVLSIWTFIIQVMSLLFNVLSMFVIAFFQGASVF